MDVPDLTSGNNVIAGFQRIRPESGSTKEPVPGLRRCGPNGRGTLGAIAAPYWCDPGIEVRSTQRKADHPKLKRFLTLIAVPMASITSLSRPGPFSFNTRRFINCALGAMPESSTPRLSAPAGRSDDIPKDSADNIAGLGKLGTKRWHGAT